MNNKVTINLPYETKSNFGGPLGYCHGLKKSKIHFNIFLKDKGWFYRIKYYLSFLFPFIFRDRKLKLINTQIFHFITDINFFNTKNCRSILMYHSPVKMSIEIKNIIQWKFSDTKKIIYFIYLVFCHFFVSFLINNSAKKAFKKADVLIFPSIGAMNNTYKNYKFDKSKVKYIPTRVMNYSKKSSKKCPTIFDSKKILIAYIGRANKEKGFFNFMKTVKLSNNKNVVFLNIGNKKKIKKAINIGLINYVDIALKKIDYLFSFPPKKSYYDLIILEARQAGISIIGNSVGGNNDLLSKNEKFQTLNNAINFINSLTKKNNKKDKKITNDFHKFINDWEKII